MTPSQSHQQDAFYRALSLESLFRYKWLAMSALIGVLLLTAAFLAVRKRDYHSLARLFVRLGRESVTVDPTAVTTGQVMMMTQSQQRQIQSVMDLLAARVLFERVVDEIGPERVLDWPKESDSDSSAFLKNLKAPLANLREQLVAYKLADPMSEREEAIKELSESVNVSSEPDSNVVSVAVRAHDPEQARVLAASFVDNFRQLHMLAHRSAGSFEFFESQSKVVKQQLDAAIDRLRDAKNQASFASVDGQRLVLEGRLLALQQDLQNSQAALQGAVARERSMRESLSELPEMVVVEEVAGLTNTAKDQMRAELYRKQLDKAGIESRFTENHPFRAQIQQELAIASEVYGGENDLSQQKTGINTAHQEFKVALLTEQAAIAAEAARVEEMLSLKGSLRKEIEELNRQEAIVRDLQREVDVLDGKYRTYVESLEKTRIDEELDRVRLSSVNLVQDPTFSDDPIDFSNTMVAVAGLMMALMAAPFTAFACAFFNNRLSTAEDVERELQIPVFLTIPDSRQQRIAV